MGLVDANNLFFTTPNIQLLEGQREITHSAVQSDKDILRNDPPFFGSVRNESPREPA
jgi:hypothetical protein